MRKKTTEKLNATRPNKNDKKETCRFLQDLCPLNEEKDSSDNENYPKLEIISYKKSIQCRVVESLILDLKTIISLFMTQQYEVNQFLQELTIITKSLKAIIYPGQTRITMEKANILLLKKVVDSLRKERDDYLPDESEGFNKNNKI
jgi:hypothetical protein